MDMKRPYFPYFQTQKLCFSHKNFDISKVKHDLQGTKRFKVDTKPSFENRTHVDLTT